MRFLPMLIAVLISGCADTGQDRPPMAVVRTDGQTIDNNKALRIAFTRDHMVCMAETEKAKMGVNTYRGGGYGGAVASAFADYDRDQSGEVVLRGCLAERGYVVVPKKDEVAAEVYYREANASK